MSSKKYDVVAAVGKYTDQYGQEKTRWQTVGAVLQTENGHCLLIEKWFNPAGLAEPGQNSVLLNLFVPQPKDRPEPSQQPSQPHNQPPSQPAGDPGFDDRDVPF